MNSRKIIISRCGAFADHGTSRILFEPTEISWDSGQEAICLKARAVSDFSTNARHNYETFIPLAVLSDMIDEISINGINSSKECVKRILEGNLKSLVRLIAVASGIFPDQIEAVTLEPEI